MGSPGRILPLNLAVKADILPCRDKGDRSTVQRRDSSRLYRTAKASDGTRTHALRLADSDASHYITPAFFERANNEI